jgi:hypothetical protein
MGLLATFQFHFHISSVEVSQETFFISNQIREGGRWPPWIRCNLVGFLWNNQVLLVMCVVLVPLEFSSFLPLIFLPPSVRVLAPFWICASVSSFSPKSRYLCTARSGSWAGAGSFLFGWRSPFARDLLALLFSAVTWEDYVCVTPHVSKPHDYVNNMFMRP